VFSSFLQAGFECSTHKLRNGRRLDLVSSTFHDRYLEKDYERMLDMGMSTAREGIRWHLIEPRPKVYDFSSVLPFIEAGQRMGIQIVWDLLHFGWPDHLDVFSEAWRESFTQLAAKFAQLLRAETSTTAYIAPINEISFLSWAAGDDAHVFPFEHGRGSELKRQLVRAAVAASQAIKSELADSRLVSPEPVIHIIGDPNRPDDVRQAEAYRTSMFEAWDMLAGRIHPELGGSEKYLDVIGINYYDRNQWWNHGETIFRGEPQYRPFREILREVHERYRRPMFIAETGTEGEKRAAWFAYICDEVNAARESGVDLHGMCLYPIVNHPGWNDDRHCYNGLWDYPDATGNREIYQPLADEIRKQEHLWKGMAEIA
jgi:beta-glucosidase/6-phospho-beta-glucosidase/beta-galactosidase